MPNGTCERKKNCNMFPLREKVNTLSGKTYKAAQLFPASSGNLLCCHFLAMGHGPFPAFFHSNMDTNTNANSCFSHFSQMFRNWDFIHRRRYKWDLSPSSSCFWIYSWLIHVCLITFLQIYTNFHFSNEFSNFLLPLTLNVEDEGTI